MLLDLKPLLRAEEVLGGLPRGSPRIFVRGEALPMIPRTLEVRCRITLRVRGSVQMTRLPSAEQLATRRAWAQEAERRHRRQREEEALLVLLDDP